MDAVTPAEMAQETRAIEFTGTMREYLPIVATNALLTLVTLFVYRSWAKARSRRYLWSRTRFIDDDLQWTGTGVEMFVGFILVALMVGAAYLLINIGLPALAIREGVLAGFLAVMGVYAAGIFLYALARFRGLRYRLARTWWRGIRGGSDDGGWSYGRKAIGYYSCRSSPWASPIRGRRQNCGTNVGTRCRSDRTSSKRTLIRRTRGVLSSFSGARLLWAMP